MNKRAYRFPAAGLARFAPALLLITAFSTALYAGNIEAGKKKAEVCQACHGPYGVSQMPNVPNIGGQGDQYIQLQLVYFRNEQRKNELMTPIATPLSDDDIRNLGAYIATWPAPDGAPLSSTDKALFEKGKQVAERNRCATCHGEDFSGIQAAPRLAHQRAEYISKSLKDFRDNGRPSTGVGAMTEISARLSDADMRALGAYFQHLGK